MTAKIINLRQARKAKARAEKDRQAEENRARHGRSKAERHASEAEAERAVRRLDGLRLVDTAAGPGSGPDAEAAMPPHRDTPEDGSGPAT